eukprot:scaffold16496_cov120-Isochrysis_galbana.AAC.6
MQRVVLGVRQAAHGVPVGVAAPVPRPGRHPLDHRVHVAESPPGADNLVERGGDVVGAARVAQRRDDEVDGPSEARRPGAAGPGEQFPRPLRPRVWPAPAPPVPVHWCKQDDPGRPEAAELVQQPGHVDARCAGLEGQDHGGRAQHDRLVLVQLPQAVDAPAGGMGRVRLVSPVVAASEVEHGRHTSAPVEVDARREELPGHRVANHEGVRHHLHHPAVACHEARVRDVALRGQRDARRVEHHGPDGVPAGRTHGRALSTLRSARRRRSFPEEAQSREPAAHGHACAIHG